VVALGGFVAWEHVNPEPMVPLNLFRHRNFSGGSLSMALLQIGNGGLLLVLTQYLQFVLGYSPVKAGLAFVPLAVAAIIGNVAGAQLSVKIGPRIPVLAGMLVMADSGLYSYTNFKMVLDAGADALFRVGANVELPVLEWFPDGSYLSFIADSKEKARNSYRLRHGLAKITDLPGFYVRVVDYEIPDRGDGDEIITLVTNITDPNEIPATELAVAYHQRWEAELVFDELKTHQRGAGMILRSRKPELVEQEIWGLLLTHYGIRHLMREAADQAELDPDRMSFIRTLRVIRRQVSGQAAFSPSETREGSPGGN